MKMTHLFAMHGHFAAGRGMLLLLVIVAAGLLIALWPGKSQTK